VLAGLLGWAKSWAGVKGEKGWGKEERTQAFGPKPGVAFSLFFFLFFSKAFFKRILRTINYKPKAINTEQNMFYHECTLKFNNLMMNFNFNKNLFIY
jgi:hypothetical protein